MQKQPDNAPLLYLHLRVVVVQCLGTDRAQNWTFLSPVLWSWAASFMFSVKNIFLCFSLFFFFFGGGRGGGE